MYLHSTFLTEWGEDTDLSNASFEIVRYGDFSNVDVVFQLSEGGKG